MKAYTRAEVIDILKRQRAFDAARLRWAKGRSNHPDTMEGAAILLEMNQLVLSDEPVSRGIATFVPFSRLPEEQMNAVVVAARPRIHVEPVVLHKQGSDPDGAGNTMAAIHLQIDTGHALLLMEDLDGFGQSMEEAVAKLEEALK